MRHRSRTRLVAVLVGALVVAACSSGNVFGLEVGDCFQDPAEGAEEVTDVEVVDCDEPHDHEVFHTFELEGEQFPEGATMEEAIDGECLGATFEDYVGEPYATSEFDVVPITPTPASWDDGDRAVTCSAWHPEGPTEGSLQGSER